MCDDNPQCAWRPELAAGMTSCQVHHLVFPQAQECPTCSDEATIPEPTP